MACGLTLEAGTLECWGSGADGFLSNFSGSTSYVAVDVARGICAIRAEDRIVDCSQLPGAPNTPMKQIAIGRSGSCGITSTDRTAVCWRGYEYDAPEIGQPLASIAAGLDHTCARDDDGKLICWGRNSEGRWPPTGASYRFLVSEGREHCALTIEGAIECWGQAGTLRTELLNSRGAFSSISLSPLCGTKEGDGTLICADLDGVSTPVLDVAFLDIAGGPGQGCGIRADNRSVECWGIDVTPPPMGAAFESLVGRLHSYCGIRVGTRAIECWGAAVDEAVGLPAGAYAEVAITRSSVCGLDASTGIPSCNGSVVGVPDVPLTAIAGGYSHYCGLRASDNKPVCWGGFADSNDDIPTSPDFAFSNISAGFNNMCGLRLDDGTEVCWGELARNLYSSGS